MALTPTGVKTFINHQKNRIENEFSNRPLLKTYFSRLISTTHGALGARFVPLPFGLGDNLAPGAFQLQGFFAGHFGIRSVRTHVRP